MCDRDRLVGSCHQPVVGAAPASAATTNLCGVWTASDDGGGVLVIPLTLTGEWNSCVLATVAICSPKPERTLAVTALEGSPNPDGTFGFDLSIDASRHTFIDDLQANTLAYNGQSVLGPTIEISTGTTVEIDVTNDLDERTTTHWHGADLPAVADGGPHSIIEPSQTWRARFEVIQPAATLWYHPHLHGLTAEQVYHGGAGFLIVKDDNPLAADLPKTYGVDDIPLVLQDRNFMPDGQMDFGLENIGRGRLMETLTVNATIDPYIEVPQGLVRLRLLNGSQARIYSLSVAGSAMTKIASDGGYLVAPVELDRLDLSPGDRAEIVVEVGTEPVMLLDSAFDRVVELRPTSEVSTATEIPDQLAVFGRIDEDEIDVDRSFNLSEVGEEWGINGEVMDMTRVDETIRYGDTERWTVTVDNGQHAFHVHQTQFQILSINGEPPPPEDAGWEDTVWVNGSREVEIAMRFDTYTNPDIPYMFHCHILDHEDLGMMGQFRVVDG